MTGIQSHPADLYWGVHYGMPCGLTFWQRGTATFAAFISSQGLGGRLRTASDEASLSKRTGKRPRREDGYGRPDHKKVDPDVRLRGPDVDQPLPERVEYPRDARHKERSGMAASAEGRGP
jgi:hypothetical protein